MALSASNVLLCLAATICVASASIDMTADTFQKTSTEKDALLVMFYAPWCPHCQTAKEPYTKVATEINKDSNKMMTMVNCDDAKNTQLCQKEKVEGYPTFKLYGKGKHIQDYEDEPNEESFKTFMTNPPKEGETRAPAKKQENEEPEEPDTFMEGVVYLGGNNYTETINKYEYAMVFYYAPWCPHCKDSKPKFQKAAEEMKKMNMPDKLVAAMNCDAKENTKTCEDNKVEGYPTIRLLKKNEIWAEFEEEIETPNLVTFISKPPKEKVPPTPVEKEGEEKDQKEGDQKTEPEKPEEKMKFATYLDGPDGEKSLKSADHALVMFYAPWCPHCVQAKPVFDAAAKKFENDNSKMFAAVNCDAKENTKICEDYKIEGFPTFLRFEKGVRKEDYPESPITTDGAVKYMQAFKAAKDEL